MAHDHGHGHGHAPTVGGRVYAWGIGLNLAYLTIEAIVGLTIGSLGLVADAGHNASDVLSMVVAWVGQRLALRPPSERFSYGLRRAPILGSLFNALLLFGAMGALTYEAIRRLMNPAELGGLTITYVAIAGLVVNFGTAWLFSRGGDDLNVRGVFLHMLADGLVTLGVVIAGVIIALTGARWVDPAISLAIVVVVVWTTWGLFTGSLRMLADAVPQRLDLEDVRGTLRDLPGVADVHDVHVWPLSTREVAATAHLVLAGPLAEPNRLIRQACESLQERHEIVHTTVQLEYGEPRDPCGLREGDRFG